MRTRRKAREAVLQSLYQCDTLDDWSIQAIDTYFHVFKSEICGPEVVLSATEKENFEFCKKIILGVIGKIQIIDRLIGEASTNWSVSRMCRVDRNILRCATYELCFLSEVPTNVAINEAIEISKSFGTHDSPMFINGVLDNIAGVLRKSPDILSRYEQALTDKIAVNA